MTYVASETHAVYAGMIRKQLAIGIVLLLALSGLLWRLFNMQVLNPQQYMLSAQSQRTDIVPQPAPRGEILDRHGRTIADSVPRYDVTFYVPDVPLTDWSWIERLTTMLKLEPDAAATWQEEISAAKPYTRVILINDVPLARLIELAERTEEFPGIGIATGIKRSYPYAQATAQITGYMGKISPAEYERLGPADYKLDSEIGKGGLEQQYDLTLRGEEGFVTLEVDHRGRVQRRITEPLLIDPETGEEKPVEQAPQQGPALKTTLDAELQAGIARVLQGYAGSAIVMDVHSGELLAAVSVPSFDPNLFGSTVTAADAKDLFTDETKPINNRVSGSYYIPGSTWKIVTALAGLEEKVITEHTSFYCDGVYHTKTKDFRCHKLSGHGREDLRHALADSCDDYFYQLGIGLGPDRISKWAHVYGFGEPTGIDLPAESLGLVPTSEWKREQKGERWYPGDTIPYAIGQGYVNVTPLQMARAYAFLANDGWLVTPHLNAESKPKPVRPELQPDPKNLQIIREGVRMVVRSGTARGAAFSDVAIAGKTGTADHVTGKRPHTWFASFAPYEEPKIVVVVMLESVGGKGGESAWSFARKIYQLPEIHPYLGLTSPAEEAQAELAKLSGEE